MPAVRASAWRCPTIWMPTGMPPIASMGTVTAGAPRIEVGLLNTESPVLLRPRGAGPGERGEPVPRLLALQQAQAVIVKRQLTAGFEPFVKCITVFAGILLDQIFEAPPVLQSQMSVVIALASA